MSGESVKENLGLLYKPKFYTVRAKQTDDGMMIVSEFSSTGLHQYKISKEDFEKHFYLVEE